MPTLTVTPNPCVVLETVRVDGAGFNPKKKIQLALDGVGVNSNIFRPSKDGTFYVGIKVSSVPKTQTLTARYLGSTIIVATTKITVTSAIVVPPPPVTPPPPTPVTSKTVASILELKEALKDNNLDEIIVKNGTYRVSTASSQRADSLWIGSAYASRTKPITVRAETPLGVKLDGGGTTYFGAISFEDGAHDQTWVGFEPINGNPTSTGAVVFGGYPNGGKGPFNITLRNWHFGPSIVGRADPAQWTGVSPQDHAIYISNSPISGPKNLLFEDITVDQPLDGRIPLFAAFNMGHAHNYSADGVTIRRLSTKGLVTGWVTWAPSGYITPVRNVVVEDSQILGYKAFGIRVEGGFENLTFRNITTQKDPRYPGVDFYSSLGNPPAGVTIINCSFSPAPANPTSVTVSTIVGLLAALKNNAITEIVVKNGTYVLPGASSSLGQEVGLWIDSRFSQRTNPVLVRAETKGGVVFSGNGATSWIGLAFREGAHDQTWQGFRFANAEPTQTGVIVFGQSGTVTGNAPHRITLRDLVIEESITSANPIGKSGDHAVYFSQAVTPGAHDILIDGLVVNSETSGLDSAIHFFHSMSGAPNAHDVTIRNMTVKGTDQAIILWDSTIYNVLIEDSTVVNAKKVAVRYENPGTAPTILTLKNVTSTNSAERGFYSSLGSNPKGVVFINSNLQ